MIAVLFEAWPHPDAAPTYFDLAAALRPGLDEIDGFLSIERFQSLAEPGKLLSLSYWRDEDAVARWRNVEAHRRAQSVGRAEVFRNYRLRVAAVLRDYGPADRDQAPVDAPAAPVRPGGTSERPRAGGRRAGGRDAGVAAPASRRRCAAQLGAATIGPAGGGRGTGGTRARPASRRFTLAGGRAD